MWAHCCSPRPPAAITSSCPRCFRAVSNGPPACSHHQKSQQGARWTLTHTHTNKHPQPEGHDRQWQQCWFGSKHRQPHKERQFSAGGKEHRTRTSARCWCGGKKGGWLELRLLKMKMVAPRFPARNLDTTTTDVPQWPLPPFPQPPPTHAPSRQTFPSVPNRAPRVRTSHAGAKRGTPATP
jgi:hypothetical protein